MNKLSPKLKIGCSKCGSNDLNFDIDNSNIVLSKRESKVTSVKVRTIKNKSTKVVSLF